MQLEFDPDADVDDGDPTADHSESRGLWWYASRGAFALAVLLILSSGIGILEGGSPFGPFSSEPQSFDVEGHDEEYGEMDLSVIEQQLVADIDDRRNGADLERLDGLHDAAKYHNHRAVAKHYRGWGRESEQISSDVEAFAPSCNGFGGVVNNFDPMGSVSWMEHYDSERELASMLAENFWGHESTRERLNADWESIGADVFVTVEGEVLVAVYLC